MANSRFVLTNYAESATVKNGSGGSAPNRDETSPFVMERALNADRRSLWKSGLGTGLINVDLDLGAARSISYAGLHGLTTLPSDSSGLLSIYYATSYYPGSWSTFGSTVWASGDRDCGVVTTANTSARYWRFAITLGSPATDLSLGRLVLGNALTYDLGGIHSPGGESSPFQNRIEQALQDGSINLNTLGFPGRDFTLPFHQATSTTRNLMKAIAAWPGSVIFIDAEGAAYEVIVNGGRLNRQLTAANLYSLLLEMRRLP